MATEIPQARNTKTARALGNETVGAEYDGTTGTDLPQGADKFFLTPEEQREYGIGAHETYRWVQKPEVWARGTGTDRVREIRRLGGRLIEDPALKGPVDMQDLVLVAVPKALEEKRSAQEEAEYDAYQQRIDNDGAGYEGQFDPEDKARIKRNLAAVRKAHSDAGLIGPTRGNPAHWYKTIASEERDTESARLRRGTRHISRSEAEAAMVDAARMGRKGQRSYAVPDMPRDASGRLLRAR